MPKSSTPLIWIWVERYWLISSGRRLRLPSIRSVQPIHFLPALGSSHVTWVSRVSIARTHGLRYWHDPVEDWPSFVSFYFWIPTIDHLIDYEDEPQGNVLVDLFFFSTGIHQTSQIRSTCYTSAASETLIANLESWCAICTSLPPRCLTVFSCYRSWWNLVPFDLLSA